MASGMDTCSKCANTTWTCLGCQTKIPMSEWQTRQKEVAMGCYCCVHNFVCLTCYNKNPGYDAWKPVFGPNHAVHDFISGENGLIRLLKALTDGTIST